MVTWLRVLPVSPPERPDESSTDRPPQLREIFEHYGAFVCRSLRYLGVHEADLDDLVQEVFLVVCRRLQDYEEKGRARAWLYSICTRIVSSQRRLKGKRLRESTPLSERTTAAPEVEPIDRVALALGWRLLHQLTQEQREVFVLYEVEEMSMSEIAQAMNCPLQTAYSRLHKARERILAEVRRLSAESES